MGFQGTGFGHIGLIGNGFGHIPPGQEDVWNIKMEWSIW